MMIVVGLLAQFGGMVLMAGKGAGAGPALGLGLTVAGSAWLVAGMVYSAGELIRRELRRDAAQASEGG